MAADSFKAAMGEVVPRRIDVWLVSTTSLASRCGGGWMSTPFSPPSPDYYDIDGLKIEKTRAVFNINQPDSVLVDDLPGRNHGQVTGAGIHWFITREAAIEGAQIMRRVKTRELEEVIARQQRQIDILAKLDFADAPK